jgi:hypothetical protein
MDTTKWIPTVNDDLWYADISIRTDSEKKRVPPILGGLVTMDFWEIYTEVIWFYSSGAFQFK